MKLDMGSRLICLDWTLAHSKGHVGGRVRFACEYLERRKILLTLLLSLSSKKLTTRRFLIRASATVSGSNSSPITGMDNGRPPDFVDVS